MCSHSRKMSDPLVAFQYSERSGYMDVLERQLQEAGVEYIASYTPKFSWRETVLWERRISRGFRKRFIIFVDAWDTIFLGKKEDLLEFCKPGILMAADLMCWPDQELEKEYPKNDSKLRYFTPWRYLNTTPMIGEGLAIESAIDYGWSRHPIEGDENDMYAENGTDMRFWTNLFLYGRVGIRLDYECRFAQTLHRARPGSFSIEGKRVVNNYTGSKPLFIHANGKSVIPEELLT